MRLSKGKGSLWQHSSPRQLYEQSIDWATMHQRKDIEQRQSPAIRGASTMIELAATGGIFFAVSIATSALRKLLKDIATLPSRNSPYESASALPAKVCCGLPHHCLSSF